MNRLLLTAVAFACFATVILLNGKTTISYHKRSENNTIIFVSIYNSNVIVEIKNKSNKGSLKWHEEL